MKRIILYAMMAVGVLTSCSQDEGGGSSENPLDSSADPILISALSPSVSVSASGRSTGSVGADGVTVDNVWSGQSLSMFAFPKDAETGITMSDKITPDHKSAPLFNNKAVAESGSKTAIKWVDGKTVYFPRNGAYDFFGYYDDGAGTAAPVCEAMNGANVFQLPFTIDGGHDLMIAKAALSNEDHTLLGVDANKAYSSFTARRGVQPSMKFEHLLTRLVFKFKGMGESKPEEVYVRSISVKSKATGKLVFVYTAEANKGIQWDATESLLALQERAIVGGKLIMQELDKIRKASKFDLYALNADKTYKYQNKAALTGDLAMILGKYNASVKDAPNANLVGEALLVNPGVEEYAIEVEVMQYYDKNGDLIPPPALGEEFTTTDKRYYKYGLTLKASEVKNSNVPDGITKFEASASYNVTIAVYGLQPMEISAELGEWKPGGDIEVNPDDKFNE